jgi:hypothetical protein
MAAIFHYLATNAKTVLAIVIPAFTAVVGAVLGGGAGVAAGSAGKKTVQNQLATSQGKLKEASTTLPILKSPRECSRGAAAAHGQSPSFGGFCRDHGRPRASGVIRGFR